MVRVFAVVALCLVVALAFAGCSSKDKDDKCPTATTSAAKTTTVSTSTSQTGGSGTSSTTVRAAHDGVVDAALLQATNSSSVSKTSTTSRATSTSAACPSATTSGGTTVAHNLNFTASPTNGSVPLNVTFKFDATGKLATTTWILAFGDGNSTNGTGARLPGNATHRFTTQGNHTARFNVTFADGVKLSRSLNLTLVGPATAALGPPPDPIIITGSVTGVDGLPGNSDETFDLLVAVQSMTITLAYDDPTGEGAIDLDWAISGPGGESGGGTNSGQEDPAIFAGPTPGTWTVSVIPFTAVETSYTITVTFE